MQNILENYTFQRIAKFVMLDSYEMDFVKVIVILVKVDEMHGILKSASDCLLDQSFCWSLPLTAHTFTTPFLY